ncbi:hypothetical protein [Bartonella sp. TP]|uniref:hypothetical protein n=1 Tax=Bartonella sp. TP TaxID=3057550 RepID=UPI0025AF7798|nr:hypothetical protein [Bartonella sp. TP]WJW79752.1 hypothetical protein QVL57_04380 [Bartonella sp. TP]
MQNYSSARFLIIIGFIIVAVAALIYYRLPSEAPITEVAHEESSVKYPIHNYLVPLSPVDKKALIQGAVRDAEQAAKAIGMTENDVGIAKQNAQMVTAKYLRPYPD